MKTFFTVAFLVSTFLASSQEVPWPRQDVCLTNEEVKLYELITAHRLENGLPAIPISINLTWVAQMHAFDLLENNVLNSKCNLHSWSDHGPWEGCCYTDNHSNPECMWNKPREFTTYQGRGYEIVFYYHPLTEYISLAENAIKGWKGSPGHNNTLLNKGEFERAEWNAIGIGIVGGYVTVWFGERLDTEEPPPFCREITPGQRSINRNQGN